MMLRYALAAIVVLVGLVFIGQGLGYIGGSGMTGQPFWALVGAVMVVGGAVFAAITFRTASR
jgi:hypothetical protein